MDVSAAGLSDLLALHVPNERIVLNEQVRVNEIYFLELKLLHQQSTVALDALNSRGFKPEVSWSSVNAMFKPYKGYSVHFGRSMVTNCYEFIVKSTYL